MKSIPKSLKVKELRAQEITIEDSDGNDRIILSCLQKDFSVIQLLGANKAIVGMSVCPDGSANIYIQRPGGDLAFNVTMLPDGRTGLTMFDEKKIPSVVMISSPKSKEKSVRLKNK